MQYTSIITDYFNYLPTHIRKVLSEYDKSLTENRFFIYKDYLLNSTATKQIKFNKNRWEMRPHLFCFDNYSEDNQFLYPVILTVNNIRSFHDFLPENFKDQIIYTPSLSNIQEVLTKK